MKNAIRLLAPLCLVALIGCSTQQQEKITTNIGLPNWVISPQVEDGLADSACVPYSGHFTIDRDQAIAMARNGLVQQIEIRAASLTKTYASRTDTTGGTNVGANFEVNARQIAEATLRGTKATRVDVFDISGQKQLCAQVVLSEQKLDDIAEQIIARSGATLSNADKAVLREEMKADQGQQELKDAL